MPQRTYVVGLVLLLPLLLLAACVADDAAVETPAEATASPLLPVAQDGQWGYIDRQGRVQVEPQFDGAWSFSENLALVQVGEQYGYINTEGAMVIEPRFDDAWHFSGGLAPVQRDGQWVYIDPRGETAVETTFRLGPGVLNAQQEQRPQPFGRVRTGGQYGYRNEAGEMVIEPQFDRAWHFRDDRARVRLDGQWGYIDTSGAWVVEPQFDRAWDFRGGLALVQVEDRYGYIDRDGTYVWEPTR